MPPPISIEALREHLERDTGRPVRVVETHISWVLLDGRHAWKIKKPVRLGFLDFGELETRRRYCLEELRLNRRLAPDLYEAVVAVRGSADDPRLDNENLGDGPPIEYALRMKQFAAGALFSASSPRSTFSSSRAMPTENAAAFSDRVEMF